MRATMLLSVERSDSAIAAWRFPAEPDPAGSANAGYGRLGIRASLRLDARAACAHRGVRRGAQRRAGVRRFAYRGHLDQAVRPGRFAAGRSDTVTAGHVNTYTDVPTSAQSQAKLASL